MSVVIILLRHELRRLLRTFRLPGLLLAALFVGLGSPALAWFTPRILASLPPEELQGVQILMGRAPEAADAFGQYLGNFSLLSILVLLLFSGSIAEEFSRGTASTLLAWPIRREALFLARLAAALGCVTVAVVLAGGLCWSYTVVLFGPVNADVVLAIHGLVLLRLVLDTTLALALSAWTSSGLVAGGAALGLALSLNLLGALPGVGAYTPGALVSLGTQLAYGQDPRGLLGAVAGAAALIVVLAALGVIGLRRRTA